MGVHNLIWHLYHDSKKTVEPDYNKSIKWYTKMAKKENYVAQIFLKAALNKSENNPK